MPNAKKTKLSAEQATDERPIAETVACSIVVSRLDYCNVMLYSTPAATLNTLQ